MQNIPAIAFKNLNLFGRELVKEKHKQETFKYIKIHDRCLHI